MADLKQFAENENVLSYFQKAIQNNNLYELLVTIQDKEKRQMMFDELNENDKQKILLSATFDTLKDEIKSKARAAAYTQIKDGGSDFDNDIFDFLKVKSERTAKLYKYNLHFFTDWIYANELNPIALTAKNADDYFIYIKSLSLMTRTKLNIAAAVSSFYDYLTRHRNIGNPFKKSDVKINEKKDDEKNQKTVVEKKIEVPTAAEVIQILDYIKHYQNKYYPIFSMMSKYGLRAGAFENARVYKNNNPMKYYFETVSKGKSLKIEIAAADFIDLKKIDFRQVKTKTLEQTFRRIINRMFDEKLINAKYSCHDLRHYFAVTEYQKNKDIYALKTKLNHSSIATTEIYLRSLKII